MADAAAAARVIALKRFQDEWEEKKRKAYADKQGSVPRRKSPDPKISPPLRDPELLDPKVSDTERERYRERDRERKR
jgi:hypothetical protein